MNEMNMMQAKATIKNDIKAGICPLLLGEAGIGKSSMVESLEEVFGTKVFTIPINQMADRADITGARMVQDEATGKWAQAFFPHATIREAMEYATSHPDETPILFMDEINRATSDITSTVLAFITTRRIGTENFPPNLRFVTAGNDKGNIVSLDDASLTRFAIYHVRPDVKTFLSVQALNKFVEKAVRENPALLSAKPLTEDRDGDDVEEADSFMDILDAEESSFTQLTTPRTITFLSDFLNACGITGDGSEEEMNVLTEGITEMVDDEHSLLRCQIEGHIGRTMLAEKVFDNIFEYFQSQSSGGSVQANGYSWQPQSSVIKALKIAQCAADAESVITTLSDEDKEKFLLFAISGNGRTAVNNMDAMRQATLAVLTFVGNSLSPKTLQQLVGIVASEDFDADILNEMKNSPDFAEAYEKLSCVLDVSSK